MNQLIGKTQERWQGRYPPEVGNYAGSGGLVHAGASYGIVTEVAGELVTVVWYLATRRQHSHPEVKDNGAARRVVLSQILDSIER